LTFIIAASAINDADVPWALRLYVTPGLGRVHVIRVEIRVRLDVPQRVVNRLRGTRQRLGGPGVRLGVHLATALVGHVHTDDGDAGGDEEQRQCHVDDRTDTAVLAH